MRAASFLLTLFCLIPGMAITVHLCTVVSAYAASSRQVAATTPRLWSDVAAWLSSPMTPAKFVIVAAFAAFLLYIGLKVFVFAQRRRAKKKPAALAQKESPPPSIQDEAKSFFCACRKRGTGETWMR